MKNIVMTAFALTLTLLGCSSAPTKTETKAQDLVVGSDLTRTDAQARKARLSQIAYEVRVKLPEHEAFFSGVAVIDFQLKGMEQPLRVDFFEGKISHLTLNNKSLDLSAKKPYWIELPVNSLKEGANRLVVTYTQEYSRQGQGLHKFTDPQTKEVFLHTQFETFNANRFMPCFDQPDLRATLTLHVDAPNKWEVISATQEVFVKAADKGRKLWVFPATPAISTYLYSLHAGPFKVWKDQFEDIPLRIFARPSMAQFVRAKEWFTITKQGLKFFNSFFGMKYPFKKYDQLFVPEFNAGAMENVAAVTFTENFLERGKVTRARRRDAAGTLLHEMAHMWFGDIVTMKWWNDLWLNESFATFMATLAKHDATEFKESWQEFFAEGKNSAYWEDGLVTTHPIEAQVPTVKAAFANFDGITYGKGAAVMKQLRVYMTPEAFQLGMQDYFKKHAYQNTDLQDFMTALQGRTQRDLHEWANRWLRQSGTDKITANWTCEGNSLKQVELVMTPSKGADFRPQTMQIALFSSKNGRLTTPSVMRVQLTQPRETIKGSWNCPTFVYPNYDDEGYISVQLDPKSLEFAKKNIGNMSPDLLLKTMVWDDLWEMVRSTAMPLKDYVAILEKHFLKETDAILLEQIVDTISGQRGETGTVLFYWPKTDQARTELNAFIGKMESEYLNHLRSAAPGSDMQKFWFDAYVDLARTPAGVEQLSKWAKNKKVAAGFTLDVDRHWKLAKQLSRYNRPAVAKSVVTELKMKDPSDRGQRHVMAIDAIQPSLTVKEKWVSILKQPKPSVTYAEARSVLNSMFPMEQRDLAKPFANDFYQYIESNGNSENTIFVEKVASNMVPLNCNAEQSMKLRQFLSERNSFAPSVVKTLRAVLDEDERCQNIRAMSKL